MIYDDAPSMELHSPEKAAEAARRFNELLRKAYGTNIPRPVQRELEAINKKVDALSKEALHHLIRTPPRAGEP